MKIFDLKKTNKELNPVIDNKKSGKSVDDYLKPKKHKYKLVFIIIGLILLCAAGWLTFRTYSAYSKIVKKNSNGGAPFLNFLDNISPDKLQGEGDGRINILLLGAGGALHPGGNLTDTIQVVSIDPNNKKIATLSIPRDLYVDLPEFKGKINEVYSYGEANDAETGGGAQFTKEIISKILDLPIHYYVKMDFDGFKKIVDEVGGIDINVPKVIDDPFYPAEDMIGYDPFYIETGQTHMDGSLALKYARSRETTSDFDRSARQQQILMALKDKLLSLGIMANPAKISGILDILSDHLRTDIELKDMQRLADILQGFDANNIITKVLDNSAEGPLTSYSDGAYYLVTKTGDYKEIQKIVHEIFTDPYLQKENARIEVLNGSSQAGTGKEAADLLTSYGYNIINLDKNNETVDKTVIYDYGSGKFPFTIKYLEDRFGAQVITKPKNNQKDIDITLIIGNDYLNQ